LLKNNVKYQGQGHNVKGLNLSNIVCEYEVNLLTNKKVIRGKQNFTANCKRRRTKKHPPAQTDSPIYKPNFSLNTPAKNQLNSKLAFHVEYIKVIDNMSKTFKMPLCVTLRDHPLHNEHSLKRFSSCFLFLDKTFVIFTYIAAKLMLNSTS